jgi:guanine deaminase
MPNIGLGLDKPLLEWLDAYTFPLESQYKDDHFARHVYHKVVENLIASGTTTACYFATIYEKTTKVLTDEILKQGQRALIGKVSSNRLCPDYYIEASTEQSVKDNIEFIQYVLGKNVSCVVSKTKNDILILSQFRRTI